jgi:hypothetical protein
MKTTVGPLSPSVYWRRRALVLGAILLVVLVFSYSCSSSGNANPSAGPDASSTSPSPTVAPNTLPTGLPSTPSSALPSGTPSGLIPSVPVPSLSASIADTGIPLCTDAQIQVTPVITSTDAPSARLVLGGTYDIKLKVRNISTTTCRRDVGNVAEELRITQGSTKIWSSDDCAHPKSPAHDIRTFGPDIEIYADVKWDSYDITTSGCTKSKTPAPEGKYTLTGRVGTKSAVVPFRIS